MKNLIDDNPIEWDALDKLNEVFEDEQYKANWNILAKKRMKFKQAVTKLKGF